jgi:hypothetical protein
MICFRTMAEMQTAAMPAPIPDAVVLLGYYGPGDGGGGMFGWDAASNDADDGGLVIKPAWAAGSGRWRRHFEHTVSVRWFGAFASAGNPGETRYGQPAGSPDNLTAFRNAIRALTPGAAPLGYFGPRVVVPPGLYEMGRTLTIDRSVAIVGAGGFYNMNASLLHFPADIDGVHIYRDLTALPPSLGGGFSILEGLQIISDRRGSAGHGIRVDAPCSLTHCHISGFGGNGVHIEARARAGTNAKHWHMSNVLIDHCENGLYVEGPDTNAGTCIGVSVASNRGLGIFDRSSLGNTYVGCHAAANQRGSYSSDNDGSRSIFLGCYAEDGQLPAVIGAPALVIGGLIDNAGTGGYIGQETSGVKTVSPALSVSNRKPQVTVQLGSPDPGKHIALEIESDDNPGRYFLLYNNRNSRIGWWEWNWAHDFNAGNVLAFCHKMAPEFDEKVPGTVGTVKAWLPHGVYIGMPRRDRTPDNDGRVYITAGREAPTTGTWSCGDQVLNNEPNDPAKAWAGWICIAGSSEAPPAGTWVPFGRLPMSGRLENG